MSVGLAKKNGLAVIRENPHTATKTQWSQKKKTKLQCILQYSKSYILCEVVLTHTNTKVTKLYALNNHSFFTCQLYLNRVTFKMYQKNHTLL